MGVDRVRSQNVTRALFGVHESPHFQNLTPALLALREPEPPLSSFDLIRGEGPA